MPFSQAMDRGVVQFIVQICPSPILNGIFYCGQEQDYNERYCTKRGIGIAEDGKYLSKRMVLVLVAGHGKSKLTPKIMRKRKYIFAIL